MVIDRPIRGQNVECFTVDTKANSFVFLTIARRKYLWQLVLHLVQVLPEIKMFFYERSEQCLSNTIAVIDVW